MKILNNFMKKMLKQLNGWNDRLATIATRVFSSMWTFWAFLLLVMIPTFIHSTQMVIMFISSSVLQLVALPLLAVGQKLLNKSANKRDDADHKKILEEFQLLKDLINDSKIQNNILNEIEQKIDDLKKR